MDNASHVRSAISRFTQAKEAGDRERDRAWRRIGAAAEKYKIKVTAGSWRGLSREGKPGRKKKQQKQKT